MKTVKAIYTSSYSISLNENEDSTYQTRYGSSVDETTSEKVRDLNIASMLFDIKLDDLMKIAAH